MTCINFPDGQCQYKACEKCRETTTGAWPCTETEITTTETSSGRPCVFFKHYPVRPTINVTLLPTPPAQVQRKTVRQDITIARREQLTEKELAEMYRQQCVLPNLKGENKQSRMCFPFHIFILTTSLSILGWYCLTHGLVFNETVVNLTTTPVVTPTHSPSTHTQARGDGRGRR